MMRPAGLVYPYQPVPLRMLSEIYAVWLREMKRHWAGKGRLLALFTPPLLWLGIIGVGFSAAFELPEELNLPYLDFMAPGIIAQVALLSAIISGVSVVMDRNFGFMRGMLVAPVSRESIFFGKLLGGVTIATINSLVLLLVAIAMGAISVQQPLWHFGAAILLVLLISTSFISLGMAMACKLKADFFMAFWGILVLPLIFLSGAFYPISLQQIPQWLEVLAWVDPLTYGVDGLRGLLVQFVVFPIQADFMVMIGFTLVMVALATYLFREMSFR